jgi:hypothetical protein
MVTLLHAHADGAQGGHIPPANLIGSCRLEPLCGCVCLPGWLDLGVEGPQVRWCGLARLAVGSGPRRRTLFCLLTRSWHLGALRRCMLRSKLVISDEAFARPTGVTQRVASAGGVYLFRVLQL